MQILKFLTLGYTNKSSPGLQNYVKPRFNLWIIKEAMEDLKKFYKVFVNLTSYIIIFKLTLGCS